MKQLHKQSSLNQQSQIPIHNSPTYSTKPSKLPRSSLPRSAAAYLLREQRLLFVLVGALIASTLFLLHPYYYSSLSRLSPVDTPIPVFRDPASFDHRESSISSFSSAASALVASGGGRRVPVGLRKPPLRIVVTGAMAPSPYLTALTLALLLLAAVATATDDLDGLDELLAIDDEEDLHHHATSKSSDTEILTRAQRIVLDLSNENAQRVIAANELVLVLGYAPWCPRSAELMPRFAEAAAALRELGSPIVTAKLDAERHAKAASVLGVKGFPTVLLFVNGTARTYTGGFTGEEILIWARKKTGHPVTRVSSVVEAEEFLRKHQMFVFGFFESYEGLDYGEFVKAATDDNEFQFVESSDVKIAKVLVPHIVPKKYFIALVKSEPEKFEYFEDKIEHEKILQFVEYNKFPLVTALTELNSARVYSSPIKLQVFIFAEADDFKHLNVSLQDVARKYKTKILFVYVDSIEDNLAKPFLTLFGLESDKPIVAAFDNRVGSKYLLESDPTSSNVEKFCSSLLHAELSPYFKSEPKPDEKGIVEKVVSRTFDASVLESTQNVFLEVYAPWCINCEATSKEVDKLAKHFDGLDNLKFARIDASLNEHPNLQINDYPTLLFYRAKDKSNPIKLSKKMKYKGLVAFIKENIGSKVDRDVSKNDEL